MGSHTQSEDFDLLIIGAGVYGIQAARTYLTLHPTHNVLVLEAASSMGGVWSTERSYPHFWTQAPFDIWQFSDMEMEVTDEDKSEAFYDYFPAKKFSEYLGKYVDGHIYEGKTLRDRIRCGERVEALWKEEVAGSEGAGTWYIRTSTGSSYSAPKVIDASGLTSLPNIPTIPGASNFKGISTHSKDFAANASTILQPGNRIAILGGGKSAADMAYTCAKSGVSEVHWIIRKSGNGPSIFLPADPPMPIYSDSNSAFHTTFMSSILASIYTPNNWWTWFLYQTSFGQILLRLVWKGLHADVLGRAKYDREDGKSNGYANLKPDGAKETPGPLFWQNALIGVNQRPDFFDTIARKVKVYRADVAKITESSLILVDNASTAIEADAIVYATGWLTSIPYLKPSTAYSLGLPSPVSTESSYPSESEKWDIMEHNAEAKVLHRFPLLNTSNVPAHLRTKPRQQTPYRLYKSIFPITDHTIAFLGKTSIANHTYNAEVQSLYAIAVLDGKHTLPSRQAMEEDVALVRAWQDKRYPAHGPGGEFLYFDALPYTDALLEELGLRGHRRGVMQAMSAKRLKGLLDEWMEKIGENENKSGIKKTD